MIREEIHCPEKKQRTFCINVSDYINQFRRNWQDYPESKERESDLMKGKRQSKEIKEVTLWDVLYSFNPNSEGIQDPRKIPSK